VILLAGIETTDIFKGAFYLCMGGDLADIRFKANGKQIASFLFTGPDLYKHDKAYINGHALVNPVQFREALNHLRDILFARLKKGPTSSRHGRDSVATRGRYENDRTRKNRAHQEHG
jgi:hypothetical protein